MADSMYTVEAAVLIVLVCVLWPLYVVQLLALRFTPRRRWIPIKAVMLATGFVGTVTLTARMVDPSSVFGRIPVYANSGLAVQATAGAFIIAASWLVASARSLHAQIQQPMPRFVTPVLYGSAFAFQLIDTSLIIAQSQMLQRPDLYSEWEVNRLDIALDLVLDAQTALVFVCNTYLYIRLRQKIATFIGTLQQQEEAVERAKQRQLQQTAATPAATTAKAPPSTAAAAPAGLSPAVHIRIQVHPEPATGGGGSAATHGRTGSGGPSASASVPPSSSASADRVRDLSGALRKLTYMSFCVSLVCIGAIANSVPRLNNLFQQIVEKQDLYGPDPGKRTHADTARWYAQPLDAAALRHVPWLICFRMVCVPLCVNRSFGCLCRILVIRQTSAHPPSLFHVPCHSLVRVGQSGGMDVECGASGASHSFLAHGAAWCEGRASRDVRPRSESAGGATAAATAAADEEGRRRRSGNSKGRACSDDCCLPQDAPSAALVGRAVSHACGSLRVCSRRGCSTSFCFRRCCWYRCRWRRSSSSFRL
jgi:hypothetical protein